MTSYNLAGCVYNPKYEFIIAAENRKFNNGCGEIKTVKKLTLLIAMLVALTSISVTSFGQKRPVRKTTAPISKPKVTETPAEVEAAPVKKAVVEVSPAQGFFNQGLKCEAKDYDCQISNYTKAINLNLNTKEVFKNRGNSYLQRKDFDKAIADFTKLIELDLNDASGYKNRGRIFFENSNSPQAINAAIRDFTSANDLEPKDVEALILRAKAHFTARNNEKGVSDLTNAIRLDPSNTDLLLFQAEVFSDFEMFEKASEIYSKLTLTQPNNADLFIKRAKVFEMQNKFDLAIKDYSKAVELDSKNSNSHLGLAEIFEKDKKIDEAVREYTKAIEFSPTNSDFLFKRAKLYRQLKRTAEASADVTKVIKLLPRNAKTYEFRCQLNKEANNLTKAVEDCSVAISLDPNLDDAYIYRSDVINSELQRLPIRLNIPNDYPQFQPIFLQAYADLTTGLQNTRINLGMKIRKGEITADNFLKLASAQSRANILFPAENNYSSAIEIDSSLSAAYAGRGSNRLKLSFAGGRFDVSLSIAAIQDYQKAISLDPLNASLIRESLADHIKEVDQLQLEICDKAILDNPNNLEILYMRAKKRQSAFLHEYTKVPAGNSLQNKVKQRLLAENWNGIPKGIESDLKRVMELYDSSKKEKTEREILAEAVYDLAMWYGYYDDFKRNNTSAMEVFNKAIGKWTDIPELYRKRAEFRYNDEIDKKMADYAKADEIETKFGLNNKEKAAKIQESIIALSNSMKTGLAFAKGIPSSPSKEIIAESNADRFMRERELKQILNEDSDRQKKLEEQAAIANQNLLAMQQEIAEIEQKRKAEKAKRNAKTMNALVGLINTTVEIATKNNRLPSQTPQSNTSSRPQTTQSGELSNGGTVSAQQNWGQWSTSSCNSDIQFSVINDGPVPGDNTRTYWRIRARSRNGKQASLEVFYGESQAEISYAIANRNANARGESRSVIGVAYLESDRIKTNFPQVDIRNNSNIFVRIVNIGWMDSGGRIVENVRCGGR